MTVSYSFHLLFLYLRMAEGVQHSRVLVSFLTPAYEKSANCKKELTYAMQLGKPIIPCLLGSTDDPKWRPSDWLGLSISDLLYLNWTDIHEKNFTVKCDELVAKIHILTGSPSPAVSDSDQED